MVQYLHFRILKFPLMYGHACWVLWLLHLTFPTATQSFRGFEFAARGRGAAGLRIAQDVRKDGCCCKCGQSTRAAYPVYSLRLECDACRKAVGKHLKWCAGPWLRSFLHLMYRQSSCRAWIRSIDWNDTRFLEQLASLASLGQSR